MRRLLLVVLLAPMVAFAQAPTTTNKNLTYDANGNILPATTNGHVMNLPAGTTLGGAAIATGSALPSQTGNSGKYLTTNGTAASWGTIDLSSYQTKAGVLALGGFSSITGRVGNANLPLGAQMYDNAGTPKLVADLGARKLYAEDGTTIALDWSFPGQVFIGDSVLGFSYLAGVGTIYTDQLDVKEVISDINGESIGSWNLSHGWQWQSSDHANYFDNTGFHGTFFGDDTAYDATSWNGNTGVPTKNAIRDKFETLRIGTDVQAYAASLTIWAGITPSANAQTLLGHTFSQMRTDLSLVPGTDVQAYDADLLSWAAITRASGFDLFTATPSSANLASLLTDETGTGALVFANTPTLVTPNIGAATGTSLTTSGNITASGGTLIAGATSTPGDVRSMQGDASANYVALKTGGGKSGIFRSNTDYFAYYSTTTGDTVVDATFASSNILFNIQGTNKAKLFNSGGLFLGTSPSDPGAGGLAVSGAIITTPQALSGAGAVNVTTSATAFTSTGASQALTLANGTNGQIKTIAHVSDGGSGVLTPTTKSGYTSLTFTNVGDTATLQYFTGAGWVILAVNGATITP